MGNKSVSGEKQECHPADLFESLSFLLLTDAIERLDTQMLEIRHLQCNIIHTLREPAFYRALRYEEAFLWGEAREPAEKAEGESRLSWFELFERSEIRPEIFHILAELWVVRLPRGAQRESAGEALPERENWRSEPTRGLLRKLAFAGDDTGKKRRWQPDESDPSKDHLTFPEFFTRKLEERLEKIIAKARGTDAFYVGYHLLCALQTLKRNILIDKLHLVDQV